MIAPTEALLSTCDSVGAKLTVMAEMAELWAFEKAVNSGYATYLGYDPAIAIRQQLRNAVSRGHDVQLHLHSQWLNAVWSSPHWQLDYSHYRMTDLNQTDLIDVLRRGRRDLDDLGSADEGYTCIGFRAGNWSTTPCARFLSALEAAGLKSDSSVFKWGFIEHGAAAFDYRTAHSNVLPWFTDPCDINRSVPRAAVLEVPIATEYVRGFRLLTLRRLSMALSTICQDREVATAIGRTNGAHVSSGWARKLKGIFAFYPQKLDFCKMSAKEMLSAIQSLTRQCATLDRERPVPLMMIGHCKELPRVAALGEVLTTLRDSHKHVCFSTYHQFVSSYLSYTAHERTCS
jgi:hypothetical protein